MFFVFGSCFGACVLAFFVSGDESRPRVAPPPEGFDPYWWEGEPLPRDDNDWRK
jgi:hypothetical protein